MLSSYGLSPLYILLHRFYTPMTTICGVAGTLLVEGGRNAKDETRSESERERRQ
jgi:hypothetical protein